MIVVGLICLQLLTPDLAWQHFKTLTLAIALVVQVSAFVSRSHHPHPVIDGVLLKAIISMLKGMRGPGPQFLFVQHSFVLHAPIVSGQFLSLPDHLVLSKWSLAPAILGLEWMRQHISSSASHSKAYT
jgi:hypothetical protein